MNSWVKTWCNWRGILKLHQITNLSQPQLKSNVLKSLSLHWEGETSPPLKGVTLILKILFVLWKTQTYHQHDEKCKGPNWTSWKLEDHFWVRDKYQARSRIDHFLNGHTLFKIVFCTVPLYCKNNALFFNTWLWAMWPKIENVTHPANKHVPVLTMHVIIASLAYKNDY